jgi:hypothetical protein
LKHHRARNKGRIAIVADAGRDAVHAAALIKVILTAAHSSA